MLVYCSLLLSSSSSSSPLLVNFVYFVYFVYFIICLLFGIFVSQWSLALTPPSLRYPVAQFVDSTPEPGVPVQPPSLSSRLCMQGPILWLRLLCPRCMQSSVATRGSVSPLTCNLEVTHLHSVYPLTCTTFNVPVSLKHIHTHKI